MGLGALAGVGATDDADESGAAAGVDTPAAGAVDTLAGGEVIAALAVLLLVSGGLWLCIYVDSVSKKTRISTETYEGGGEESRNF